MAIAATSESESYENLLQNNQEFIAAFSNLHKNSQELWEFVDRFYVSTLKTKELCATIEELLLLHHHPTNPTNHFLHGLSSSFKQHLLMREALQPFHNSSGRVGYMKKASAAFFTATAAVCAAVAAANVNPRSPVVAAAAAAASILLSAAKGWMLSILRKEERAVKREKEIINIMIMVAKILIKDLSNIHVVGRRLEWECESLSGLMADGAEEAAVRKRKAEVKKVLEELGGQSKKYGRDMNWARTVVLQSISRSME